MNAPPCFETTLKLFLPSHVEIDDRKVNPYIVAHSVTGWQVVIHHERVEDRACDNQPLIAVGLCLCNEAHDIRQLNQPVLLPPVGPTSVLQVMGPFAPLSAVHAGPTPAPSAPNNHGRVLYSSPEQDPFRLAALPAPSGRSRKRREAFSKAFECLCSAEVCLQAGRPADAAAAVVEAYWHSEGLLELSHSFQSLMHSHECLQLDSEPSTTGNFPTPEILLPIMINSTWNAIEHLLRHTASCLWDILARHHFWPSTCSPLQFDFSPAIHREGTTHVC